MSQKAKADAEAVIEAFEQFADNAGRTPEATFKLLKDEYGTEDDGTDLMNGVSFEGTDEDEDEDEDETPQKTTLDIDNVEYGRLKTIVSEAQKAGMIDEYPGNAKDDLKAALSDVSSNELSKIVNGNVEETDEETDEGTDEKTEKPETSETNDNADKPDEWFPYDNGKNWYTTKDKYDISEIPETADLKAHPSFDDNCDVDQIRHNCAKKGACVDCKVFYAGNDNTCNKCDGKTSEKSKTTDNGSNAKAVEELKEIFDISPNTARESVEAYNNGIFATKAEAVDHFNN